jgi:hypothetical protein
MIKNEDYSIDNFKRLYIFLKQFELRDDDLNEKITQIINSIEQILQFLFLQQNADSQTEQITTKYFLKVHILKKGLGEGAQQSDA